MRRIALSLALVMLFVGLTNSQTTKSMTGTVVYYSSGASGNFEVIEVRVGNKKYEVYLFRKDLPNPRIVGTVNEAGRTVKIFYTKIVNSRGYDGEVRATKIIEIKQSDLLTVKPARSSDSMNSNSSVENKTRQTRVDVNIAPKTLKQEAAEAAQNFVGRYVNQCSDSYVFGRNVVFECKHFSGPAVSGREVNEWRTLTEAERLNGMKQEAGIEWDGKAELSFSVCRWCSRDSFRSSAPEWGQWTDSRQIFFLYLRKVAGEWSWSEGIYAPGFGDRIFAGKDGRKEKKMFDNKTDFFQAKCPGR